MLWFIFGAPLILFTLYVKNETSTNQLFNRLKLKGHTVDSKITSTASKVQIAKVEKKTSVQGTIHKMNKDNLPTNKRKKRGKG